MIEKILAQIGAKIDSTAAIDYGTQYRVSKGADKAIVNVYRGKKGLRVVVQMNTPLAEELRGQLGEAKAAAPAAGPTWAAWCGSDESGKGDYFGPLTVAAVGLTKATAAQAAAWGVRDCKTLSDATALALDEKIRAAFPFKVIGWMPEEYNRRYVVARSINRLLGEAHGEVLAEVVRLLPAAEAAVVDQFGDEAYVEDELRERGVSIRLLQRPKADETDPAVAAASVVARAAFVRGIAKLGQAWGMSFHKGAGPEVLEGGRAFVRRHGLPALEKVAKLHFKTTQQLD
jgi:ribonuclease HIII